MGVTVRSTGHPLADLASALAAASSRIDGVLSVAARAAADLIGDCGGVRLVGEDGRGGPLTIYHADPDQAHSTARIIGGLGDHGDEDHWTVLHTSREPVVLPAPGGEVSAALLCPLISDDTYLGYLALARTAPGGSYTEEDVDLARDIAGEVALALTAAQAAEQARLSEERYRCVVETTLEGVWQIDPEGRTTFVNEPMAAMLGVPREKLLGRSVDGFLDGHTAARPPRWLAECREGHAGVYQTRIVRADGSIRSVQLSAAPLPDDHGPTGCSLCMVTDVTDQIQARGLKRQLDHLRRLDSLGQLIGGIAHDFKNLLTVIAGSAEMIVSEAEPGSTQHHLATEIAGAADRGKALAQQVLAFGRSGGQVETVSLPDLLDDVTQLLSRTLGEQIELNITAEPGTWPVRAERGPLEQVLVILAANARDAMRRGGVLTIHASNATVEPGQVPDDATAAGRFVRVAVTDTGGGMDQQTRQRAMEPFFTTRPAAAGLGLATAASILRSGGGHIDLESELHIGTTVTLLLPAADTPARPVPDPPPATTSRRGHILVVEDQPELAQLVRHLLQPAGYTVTVTTDPRTALETEVRPDLLLTDVIMPGMTGPELAAALRAKHPDLSVLYMSGYVPAELDPPIGDDCELIQKPFNRNTLLAAVERAWRREPVS